MEVSMAKIKTEEVVFDLTKPITDEYDFELVDVEYKKEGQNWYLRVYIDKDGGIALNDCETVSNRLSDILDEKDPIDGSYFLEVSSPGLDRPLKKERDFIRYMDREVEISLYQAVNNSKNYKGINKGVKDDILTIELEDHSLLEVPMKSVASVRLYFEF
jgi:ribosome maturation factor RimP